MNAQKSKTPILNYVIYFVMGALVTFAVWTLVAVIQSKSIRIVEADYSSYFATESAKVIVYGNSTCPHCASARKYLSDHGIPFSDRNIQTSVSAAKEFEVLKGDSVPIILTSKHRINGFIQEDLEGILIQDGVLLSQSAP